MAAAASGDFQLRAWIVDNIGGFVSGSVSIIIGHPFDTVKVRQQAGHVQYASGMECLRATVRAEGAGALFQGMLAPLLANSAMNAITFRCARAVSFLPCRALPCLAVHFLAALDLSHMRGTDERTCAVHTVAAARCSTWQQVQRMLYFDADEPNAPLDKVFLAGATAGVAQCAIATPMELVRSKLQVQNRGGGKAYAGNLDCLKRVYASEGLTGLYRGNISMMAREAPGFGVYFSVYEATKRALCPGLGKGESEPMWVEAVGGATTGAVTWTVVMPVDVISTRVSNVLSLALVLLPACALLAVSSPSIARWSE